MEPARRTCNGFRGCVWPFGSGLLAWPTVESWLVESHDYWLASLTEGTRPHIMPVWGLWLDDELLFSSSNGSRKVRNIEASAQVSVATDDAHRPVVVEGIARRVDGDPLVVGRFNDEVNRKYDTSYDVDFYIESAVIAVSPRVVFALDDTDFTGTPTRFVF